MSHLEALRLRCDRGTYPSGVVDLSSGILAFFRPRLPRRAGKPSLHPRRCPRSSSCLNSRRLSSSRRCFSNSHSPRSPPMPMLPPPPWSLRLSSRPEHRSLSLSSWRSLSLDHSLSPSCSPSLSPSTMFSVATFSLPITMHDVLVPGPSFAVVAASSFWKKKKETAVSREHSAVVLMGYGIQQIGSGNSERDAAR